MTSRDPRPIEELMRAAKESEREASLERAGSKERARSIERLNRAAAESDAATARELLTADTSLAAAWVLDGRHTVLHTASWHGSVEVARLLLEHGAELDVRDGEFDSPPIGWANENDQRDLIELLLAWGAEIDVYQAAAIGDVERLAARIETDPEALRRPGGFGTPLHEAVLHGRLEAVRWLLARGADPSRRSRDGLTALEMAERAVRGELCPAGGENPRAGHPAILEELRPRS